MPTSTFLPRHSKLTPQAVQKIALQHFNDNVHQYGASRAQRSIDVHRYLKRQGTRNLCPSPGLLHAWLCRAIAPDLGSSGQQTVPDPARAVESSTPFVSKRLLGSGAAGHIATKDENQIG